ncbi:MAG: hypothetical protein N2234_04000 [Planctomycetota bacterium]|nr:hypothetical protein [Planctomycetota bacterium]
MKIRSRIAGMKNWLFISGGIGISFIFLSWWLSAGAEAEELRRENQSQKAEIEDIIEKLSARGEIAGLQRLLKEQAPKIMSAVSFFVDFPPPPKDISQEVFLKDEETKRRKTFEKEVKKRVASEPSISYTFNWDLENRIKNKMTEAEIEEMKARICATDYIMKCALENGVTRVNQVTQVQSQEEPLEKLERTIVRYPISIRMSTKLEPLVAMIFSLSLKNRFLQILELQVEPDAHSAGFLQTTLMVAVVKMTELKVKEGEPRTAPSKTTPRTERRRY